MTRVFQKLPLLGTLACLLFSSCEQKETRLYPYGGPPSTEIAHLGNPYTREELETTVNSIYSDMDTFRNWITVQEKGLLINGTLVPWKTPATAPKTWRSPSELPPISNPATPLEGMRIAIDPGHLGGEWAAMEHRDNIIGGKYKIREGVSTRITATLLAKSLRELGAEVMLTRKNATPVTPLRPNAIASKIAETRKIPVDKNITREAEQLFVRRIEINARAALLRTFRPDLTICLHFDAGSQTIPVNMLHFILNGAYTRSEMADEDQRTALLSKLLGKVHEEELAISSCAAKIMSRKLNLPAHTYYVPNENVRAISGEPYLWYRNLLANNLYPGPVLYVEPYAMNNIITARRMAMGDYEGTKTFDGKSYPSIYREYSDALAEALKIYYNQTRKKS